MTQPTRTAIVTGGARGIGAEITRRLAADGFALVVNYARSRDAADALVQKIETAGGRAVAVQGDVADPNAAEALFDAAQTAFGGVDVIVNNAGIMDLAPMAETSDATFDRHIAVNLKGAFNGMRAAARRLRDGGRIINLSSSAVGVKLEGYTTYAATKAAVEVMGAVLAKELKGRAITVNAVAPGPVGTDLFLAGKSDELVARIAAMNPMGRLGEPDEIAAVISFLAGPDSGWVNGQSLRANGGMV